MSLNSVTSPAAELALDLCVTANGLSPELASLPMDSEACHELTYVQTNEECSMTSHSVSKHGKPYTRNVHYCSSRIESLRDPAQDASMCRGEMHWLFNSSPCFAAHGESRLFCFLFLLRLN